MNEVRETLDKKRAGEVVSVLQIEGGWDMTQRLNQMGIHVRDLVTIKRNAIFGGPVLIQIHGTEVALGRGMAKNVFVETVETEIS